MWRLLKDSLTKQLVLFSVGMILMLLVAFIVTNSYVRNSVKDNTLELNEKMLLQIERKLKDYSDKINDITMVLSYSPTTKLYFEQSDVERVKSMSDLETVFANTMLLEEDIMGIYLYDMDEKQIAVVGKIVNDDAFSVVLREKMEFGGLFYPDQTDIPYYLVYCPIFDLESQQYGKQIGMSVLLMKTDGMADLLMDSEATKNAEIYLLDGNENVIAASPMADAAEFSAKQPGNEKDYVLQYMDTAVEGWHVLSQIPRKELYGGGNGELVLVAVIYGIAGILMIVMTYFCYLNFVKRINKVDQFIKNVVNSAEERMQEDRDDEIGRVIHNLNQMLDDKERMNREISESQKRMYEIELAEKQLQILAYRNQINPHFLYNTFECIRGMALYYDMDEIAEITMALSKVFRFAVKEDNIVTVEDEINYIKKYATIIEYRFMGKIDVMIDADESLFSKRVIKLILQPLVENAVFHGLEQKMEAGEVVVTVRREWDSFILFMVEDNGCGIEEETLRQITERLDDKMSKKGIGLANIYQRLKLFYGNDVIFEIKSRPGEGTKVMVVVPDHVEEG